ncbi:MAG: V-type ATP synthase subunit D [Spirochaetaceae bacterium]|jgi:V/A-type H+-transporting ATPase subunit D|nr:V-type ATP synthase subunit D [Spirochaetaceae bacterium]
MAKLKLTKNEQKKQKDSLKRFQRYLPTLMLKKQQLQAEIRTVEIRVTELRHIKERMDESFRKWLAIFGEEGVFTPEILRITKLVAGEGNVAGVPIPVFEGAEFETAQYDLLEKPLWLDTAVDNMKRALLLDLEMQCLEEQQRRLKKELQTTSQRVNLFEKIKIPEAKTNIKKIAVYLGDQQTAAVVRGKISKRGMERASS